MREIIFRGKRLDNGEWAYGSLIDGIYGAVPVIVSMPSVDDDFKLDFEYYHVDPATVGQYTGLQDKNGKRIFEGDILLFGVKKLLVWWNDEAFQWQAKEKKEFPIVTFEGAIQKNCVIWDNIDLGWIAAEFACVGKMTTEVIGNIHDNPELIGGAV